MNSEELARLEADLAAIEARLADTAFTSKTPHQQLEDERRFRDELRSRIERERHRLSVATPAAGSLPAHAAGRWQPLALHETNRVEAEEGELPLAPLAAMEVEEPDRPAIARELTRMLSTYSGQMLSFAHRWIHDAQLKPLLLAAVRARGFKKAALELDPFGKPFVEARERDTTLPPTPFLTMATELPDEFTGLTATQQLVLEVLRVTAPYGGPFVRLSVIAGDVAQRKPVCTEAEVERALISLGHPSLRRLPLVELQGFTGRFDPHHTHCTHARLTRVGVEVLEETFPLPLLLVNGAEGHGACVPPHHPKELARAALFVVDYGNATVSDLNRYIEAPDFPDGGVILHAGIQLLWHRGEEVLETQAKLHLERGQDEAVRIVISELPWPMTGKALTASVLGLQQEGAIEGVRAVNDHSSANGGLVVIELEHLAYAWLALGAIRKSRIHQLTWRGDFHVSGSPNARRLDLADLLSAFVEHRKEVAVKRLDKAVARARERAQGAEAVVLALGWLEPVLAVMRAAVEDDEAVQGLMSFMRPEYLPALEALPFAPSHDYAKGFTEQQAKHLLTVRRLPSRQPDSAMRDWVALRSEVEVALGRLSDRQAILDVVREELRGAIERFDEPRRTRVL